MDQTINVNITPGQFRPSLHYSQGDVGRVFKIQVVDFDIPAGSTVQCVATKPSGLGFTLAGTVSGNEITFVTTDAVTDEWGRFPAEVKIINGGNVIGTANFLMIGEKNPHPDTTIDGKQEEFIPLLTLLVERIEAAAEDVDAQVPVVQQAADDAAASASEASDSADSAADSATAASGSANEASNSAIAAAASAASAAESADAAVDTFLGDTYIEDTSPYIFRQTGDGASGVGRREKLKSIVGATVAWNQMVENGNFSDGTNKWSATGGITSWSVDDGTATINTSVAVDNTYLDQYHKDIIANHVYICLADIYVESLSTGPYFIFGQYPSVGGMYKTKELSSVGWSKLGIIGKSTESKSDIRFRIGIRHNNSDTLTYKMRNVGVIDLTALFSNAPTIADYIYQLEQSTAGAGVAFFRKYFGDDYYPYDAGTLKSVEGLESHDTVGFNAWDEETANGYWDKTTGTFTSSVNWKGCKNYIPCLPNTTYYASMSSTLGSDPLQILYYDSDKNYIGWQGASIRNATFTTPSNACFMTFYASIELFSDNICINISNPAKNGQYEPYSKHSYPLDSSLTLRGLFKLANGKLYADGDEYKSDGSVNRRYGVVDLGTLSWTYTQGSANYFYNYLTSKAKGTTNLICPNYPIDTASIANMANKTMKGSDSDTRIYIKDSAYTDAASFKTAMNGVYLVYELATPTTEEADPYTELQICDPLGTEEFVTDGIVPVGNVTQYPEDLKAKLEGLPWNFSTLIAPTEATSTASRAYAIGDYLILNNVLYKVTASIASGGTITVGTNVVATTVTDEIKALRS